MFEPCLTDIEIVLASANCVFKIGDTVHGEVLIKVHRDDSPLHHNGITLQAIGSCRLRLSENDLTLVEQLFGTVDSVDMLDVCVELRQPGRIPIGTHAIPFKFQLVPQFNQVFYGGVAYTSTIANQSNAHSSVDRNHHQRLCETFHGQNVQVVFGVEVEISRPLLSGGSISTGMCEFLVESRSDQEQVKVVERSLPRKFELTTAAATNTGADSAMMNTSSSSSSYYGGVGRYQQKLKNIIPDDLKEANAFLIRGELQKTAFFIEEPIEGWIEIAKQPQSRAVRKIELEIERCECVISSEGTRSIESSAVQFTQIVDGGAEVGENVRIPINVTFPRLYVCPSIAQPTFSIGFAVKIIVTFESTEDEQKYFASKTTTNKLLSSSSISKDFDPTCSITIPITVHRAPSGDERINRTIS